MDWLIWSIIIALSVAVLIMIRKNYQIKKEAELFAGKVEDTLEAIITGRGWKAEEVRQLPQLLEMHPFHRFL